MRCPFGGYVPFLRCEAFAAAAISFWHLWMNCLVFFSPSWRTILWKVENLSPSFSMRMSFLVFLKFLTR